MSSVSWLFDYADAVSTGTYSGPRSIALTPSLDTAGLRERIRFTSESVLMLYGVWGYIPTSAMGLPSLSSAVVGRGIAATGNGTESR